MRVRAAAIVWFGIVAGIAACAAVRPPDYAATFARQAAAASPLETPLTVSTVGRPPWLDAVAAEVGVAEAPAAEALATYAAGTP